MLPSYNRYAPGRTKCTEFQCDLYEKRYTLFLQPPFLLFLFDDDDINTISFSCVCVCVCVCSCACNLCTAIVQQRFLHFVAAGWVSYYNTDTPTVSCHRDPRNDCMNERDFRCKSLLVGWLVDLFLFCLFLFLCLAALVNLVCIGFRFFVLIIN